jgi:hypothetical protein
MTFLKQFRSLFVRIVVLTKLTLVAGSDSKNHWPYRWEHNWDTIWPENLEQHLPSAADSGCTVNHLTAYEMEERRQPVFFSVDPLDYPEAPKIFPPNSTGTEQWEFDGVSEDGTMAFCFGFYRDPTLSILGTGNLRVYAEFSRVRSQGEKEPRFLRVDYATSSTIELCEWGTRGVWRLDGGSSNSTYMFEISRDLKAVRIGVDTEDLKGSLVMKSLMPPHYPDGSVYPNQGASTEVVPYYHWVEPIPVSDVHVAFEIEGEPYKWSGIGGHERLWSAFNWYTCIQGMIAVRLKAGPYTVSHIGFSSAVNAGLHRAAAVLAQDGEVIFATTHTEHSDTDDYSILTKSYGGRVTGNLKDKASGFELVMVSPLRQKQWSFSVTNENLGFEYMLGEGAGGSGFSAKVVGGPVGLKQFFGVAFAEILEFPKRSLLFKKNYVDPVLDAGLKDEL